MDSGADDLTQRAAALAVSFLQSQVGEPPAVVFGAAVAILRVLSRELPVEDRLSLAEDVREMMCPELTVVPNDGVLH